MIRITVTGSTFDIRKRLNDAKFCWNRRSREWVKTVGEASLNSTLEAIRPMRSWSSRATPVINISLTPVNINGKKLKNREALVMVLTPPRPEGDSAEDFLGMIQSHDFILSPQTAPLDSDPKVIKKKEDKIDEFFF